MGIKAESSKLDWALYYVQEMGWTVIPLYEMEDGICTCGTDCGRDAGKHPRDTGHSKLTGSSVEQVKAYWKEWPEANIGIVSGASNLCIVDCDEGFDASEAIPAHVLEHGTVRATSGSGYTHVYCQALPAGVYLAKNDPGVGSNIDIILDTFYIIAAPSNHKSGGVYTWQDGFEPSSKNLPGVIPDDLLKKYGHPKVKAIAEDKGKVNWDTEENDYGELMPVHVTGNKITGEWVSEAVKSDNPDWKSSFNVVKGMELRTFRFKELCTYMGDEGERSDHLVHCIYELCKQGFNDNQITHMLKITSIGTHPENKIDEMSPGYLPGLIASKRAALAAKQVKDVEHERRSLTWDALSIEERAKIYNDVENGFDTSDYSIAKFMGRDLQGNRGNMLSRGWMENMGNGYWKVDLIDAHISSQVSNFIHRIRTKQIAREDKTLPRINANTGKVNSILEALAKELNMDEELFNSFENHWYVSCRNGLIDLKTGTFSDRTDIYLAHQIPYDFKPELGFALREEHVKSVCQDDDTYETLRLHHALWITGETAFRKAMVLMGETGSGKTTLMTPIHRVLGSLCAHAEAATFIKGSERSDKFMEAKFPGCRLIDASEVGNMQGLKQGYFKKITGGGDTMPYRAIWGKPGEYVCEGTPVFVTDKPDIPLSTFDDATMSRIHFIKIYKTWDEGDLSLGREYAKELYLMHTLNYMVAAAQDLWKLLETGCNIPECKASLRFKKESKLDGHNNIDLWYADCIVKDDASGKVDSQDFTESYWNWCNEMDLAVDRETFDALKAISRFLKNKNIDQRIAWRNKITKRQDYKGFTIKEFEITGEDDGLK